MMKRSFARVLPIVVLLAVPTFALSAGGGSLTDLDRHDLSTSDDPVFSSASAEGSDATDAPQPDWIAGAAAAAGRAMAYGGIGRAGAMVARGKQGQDYLRNAGIMGGDAYQYTRDDGDRSVRDSDFDR